jgi:hypothetical protein
MHVRKDLAVWLLIARINSATISALQSRLIAPGESPVVYYVIACHYNHVISANAVAGLLAQIHSTEPAACSTTCGISITFGAGFLTSCIYTTNGKTFIARSQMDFHGFYIDVIQTSDLTRCVQTCANTSRCVVVSFSTQNCYLKWTVRQGGYNSNFAGMSNVSNLLLTNDRPVF